MAEKLETANGSSPGAAPAGAAASAIPFNRSGIEGQEIGHMSRSVSIGQIAGDQSYSRKCQALLEGVLGAWRDNGVEFRM
jgi:hypothetical protein